MDPLSELCSPAAQGLSTSARPVQGVLAKSAVCLCGGRGTGSGVSPELRLRAERGCPGREPAPNLGGTAALQGCPCPAGDCELGHLLPWFSVSDAAWGGSAWGGSAWAAGAAALPSPGLGSHRLPRGCTEGGIGVSGRSPCPSSGWHCWRHESLAVFRLGRAAPCCPHRAGGSGVPGGGGGECAPRQGSVQVASVSSSKEREGNILLHCRCYK